VRLANADNVFVICLGASLQLFLLCGFVGWLLHSGRIPNDTAPVLSKVQSPISPVRISPVRAKSTTRRRCLTMFWPVSSLSARTRPQVEQCSWCSVPRTCSWQTF